MGLVSPLSGCYLSFLFNASKLSEPELAAIPIKEAEDYIGMKTDVFLLSKQIECRLLKQFKVVTADDNQHLNIQRMKETLNSQGMSSSFDSSSGAVYVVKNCLEC